VSGVLNRLSRPHRKPAVVQVDNGTEKDATVVINLSCRGDKDVNEVTSLRGG
jgi:tryptophan synthase beta subunit